MMKPELIVLAAGMGSRYGGLKQVDAIGPNGEALLEYGIYDAIRAGFGRVIFIIRESIEEAFKEKFAGKFENKIEVDYVYQEIDTPIEGIDDLPKREKPWGTAHAVLVAEHAVKAPFAVINADDYYGIEGYQKMADFLTKDCSPKHYSMVGYILGKTLSPHGAVNRGVCSMDDHHALTEVVERHKIRKEGDKIVFEGHEDTDVELTEDNLVSMNFWGFHQEIFPLLRAHFIRFAKENYHNPRSEFYIPLIVNHLIQQPDYTVSVLPSNDQWYGVTYQEDKPAVKEALGTLIKNGAYPTDLWT